METKEIKGNNGRTYTYFTRQSGIYLKHILICEWTKQNGGYGHHQHVFNSKDEAMNWIKWA